MVSKKIYLFAHIFTIPIFLVIWELISELGYVNQILFPPPSSIFIAFIEMIKSGELVSDLSISLMRIFVGFLIGAFLGLIFGILTGRIEIIRYTLGQIIEIIRPIPAIAFLPVVILWFGVGELSKILLIAFGSFFPIWINAHDGVNSVEKSYIWAAKSLGAKSKTLLLEVILPAASPFIITGLRIGIGSAFTLLIVAEMAGAFAGIGFRIDVSHLVFRIDKMFVGIIILGILGTLTHKLFIFLARKVTPWYDTKQ